jgi:hypothetical protein
VRYRPHHIRADANAGRHRVDRCSAVRAVEGGAKEDYEERGVENGLSAGFPGCAEQNAVQGSGGSDVQGDQGLLPWHRRCRYPEVPGAHWR